jgi:hypothetical protein
VKHYLAPKDYVLIVLPFVIIFSVGYFFEDQLKRMVSEVLVSLQSTSQNSDIGQKFVLYSSVKNNAFKYDNYDELSDLDTDIYMNTILPSLQSRTTAKKSMINTVRTTYKLNMIMGDTVAINNQLLNLGDTVDTYKIVAIKKRAITLQSPFKTHMLKLGETMTIEKKVIQKTKNITQSIGE